MSRINPARLTVVRSLMEIERGGSAEELLLSSSNEKNLSDVDQRFAHFILFGILRERGRLDEVLNRNSKKEISKQKIALRSILRLGAYEMKFSRVPIHAVIDQAVRLTHKLGFRFASGFVNALLRKTIQESISPNHDLNVPPWILGVLKERSITKGYTESLSSPPDIYIVPKDGKPVEGLATEGFPHFSFEKALFKVSKSGSPTDWQGFKAGDWWIMDPSSAMVIERLHKHIREQRADLEVLDACAAPGSKSLRLHQYGYKVTSADVSSKRLEKLQQNRERLQYTIPYFRKDWTVKHPPKKRYDVVLLDAPCSGLGVMRRHPEIRWKRKESDITANRIIQKKLIHNLCEWIKPGGLLVYSVCSFHPKEGGDFPEGMHRLENWMTPPEWGVDVFQISILQKSHRSQ
ncbi:MAG: transcription antitermination factor NusB [Myxococcota bacterium]|nr:transcription antitermination factor NusB [Myxococcota bacterium]